MFSKVKSGRATLTAFGRLVAGMALALVAVVIVAAASPEVHSGLHADAGDEGHHCAITDYAAGESYSPVTPIAVAPAAMTIAVLARAGTVAPAPAAHYRLRPACGPPRPSQTV